MKKPCWTKKDEEQLHRLQKKKGTCEQHQYLIDTIQEVLDAVKKGRCLWWAVDEKFTDLTIRHITVTAQFPRR